MECSLVAFLGLAQGGKDEHNRLAYFDFAFALKQRHDQLKDVAPQKNASRQLREGSP